MADLNPGSVNHHYHHRERDPSMKDTTKKVQGTLNLVPIMKTKGLLIMTSGSETQVQPNHKWTEIYTTTDTGMKT